MSQSRLLPCSVSEHLLRSVVCISNAVDVHWRFTFLSGLFLQSSNIEGNSEDARKSYYFFPEPVVARFMRFTADQAKDSKCLNDLVVSGCTVGKTCLCHSFLRCIQRR